LVNSDGNISIGGGIKRITSMLRNGNSIDGKLNASLEGTAVIPQTTSLEAVHTILRGSQLVVSRTRKETTFVVFYGIEYCFSGGTGADSLVD
jgi:hypothetical protein